MKCFSDYCYYNHHNTDLNSNPSLYYLNLRPHTSFSNLKMHRYSGSIKCRHWYLQSCKYKKVTIFTYFWRNHVSPRLCDVCIEKAERSLLNFNLFLFSITWHIYGIQTQWKKWWINHSFAPLLGILVGYGFLRLHQSFTESNGTLNIMFKKHTLSWLLGKKVLLPFSLFGMVVSPKNCPQNMEISIGLYIYIYTRFQIWQFTHLTRPHEQFWAEHNYFSFFSVSAQVVFEREHNIKKI